MISTMNVKPIPTKYAGCFFRSRLEARWAVFFNEMGIEWLYEPEGFQIDDNTRYLPDFYLPRLGRWAEVKGHTSNVDDSYRMLLGGLVDYDGPLASGLLLLGDIPDVTNATYVYWHELRWRKGVVARSVHFLDDKYMALGVGPGTLSEFSNVETANMPDDANWEATCIRISCVDDHTWWPLDSKVRDAYVKARSCRFEHGDTPAVPSPKLLELMAGPTRPSLGAHRRRPPT